MIAPRRVAELESRALVAVSGPDWRGFLQGLLTQDVETLAAGELRYGAVLTPQGKLLFDLFIIGADDGCRLDVARADREALIQRLSIYRLRAQVRLEPLDGQVWVLWPPGAMPEAAEWRLDPRLPALGLRGYGATPPPDAEVVSEAVYHDHRLTLGVPDPARDTPGETTYPIEANLDLLAGIDFQKGCFVGQETTSRMKRRGAIKSRMVTLTFDGDPPAFGAEVLAGDLRAGEVRAGARGRAMALLRLDRLDAGALTVEGRPVAVERAGYLTT